MDTSEKYIKMCEKAQKDINKKEELWDWYYDKESDTIEVVVRLNTDHPMGNNYHKDEIPLYRQDQLQEMLVPTDAIALIDELNGFILHHIEDRNLGIRKHRTLEQLWLAFVMYEKYQKEWDDEKEEWVKPGNTSEKAP